MAFSLNVFTALVASVALFAVANAERHTVHFTNKLRFQPFMLISMLTNAHFYQLWPRYCKSKLVSDG